MFCSFRWSNFWVKRVFCRDNIS
ncbi:hypothetical protein Zm00014a_011461 [Zea mays]|uniref:Uncharacterized protein n=1 Tax=Zea mays TaxID=4577 RepID=A0A317YIR0_MAIZE|nr:hypothetical protein Zm00014a_011461 [Zea mays]